MRTGFDIRFINNLIRFDYIKGLPICREFFVVYIDSRLINFEIEVVGIT